jgi:hypothetical protein
MGGRGPFRTLLGPADPAKVTLGRVAITPVGTRSLFPRILHRKGQLTELKTAAKHDQRNSNDFQLEHILRGELARARAAVETAYITTPFW